ncbi:tRNA (guanosine(46)-N7)-methyltransferase TrmB [Ancylobacter sp. 6x-1]|uniref:tRNA (guanine-N(7)-)-methyltransferase n=1 Tax=Ancylobacter crimeensis TaxID=2579147 RepID=A0ABT0DDH7_9HYPH|nr:tRNA (guanosine(46)-N7)-methyltransferase TrmB [Ancylobacter crimeensis]MCK0198023.1 tRNA (guanosine(46)-N7)-methyltransferase TrmB [Ancylobacter crimeensis]
MDATMMSDGQSTTPETTHEESPAEAEAVHHRGGGAFFGRRRGKTLRPLQAVHMERDLPSLAIPTDLPPGTTLADLFARPMAAYRLEIGFGGGERLVDEVAREPDIGFIGAEAFFNGVAKATAAIAQRGLDNVRLYGDDVVPLLDKLPDAAFERIDLFYPDPWPKRRHWKRRFVRPENLSRIARLLPPGGRFRFATDVEDYAAWTLRHLLADARFEWTARRADDWRRPFAGWHGTRYEAKAIREGRVPGYFTFRRI